MAKANRANDLSALEQTRGVLIRQVTQGAEWLQAVGLPVELKNHYKISALPADARVKKHAEDRDGWAPTHDELEELPYLYEASEESSCMTRCCFSFCGCANERPLKMFVNQAPNEQGQQAHNGFSIKRPFKCGACCGWGCQRKWTAITNQGQVIGQTRENCDSYCGKGYEACCKCTSYYNINEPNYRSGAPTPQTMDDKANIDTAYELQVNLACCGPHSNCCGATCCKNDAVFNIRDPATKMPVGYVQKTYAPGGKCCRFNSACCRCLGMFNNYLVEFPEGATANQKSLIIASVLQTDYDHFEKKGNEDNN